MTGQEGHTTLGDLVVRAALIEARRHRAAGATPAEAAPGRRSGAPLRAACATRTAPAIRPASAGQSAIPSPEATRCRRAWSSSRPPDAGAFLAR
jgi:hypothetical protein